MAMDWIRDIVMVFGLVSLLLLVVGIWTHLDMRKAPRREAEADRKVD